MTSICLVGDSHTSALKYGWQAIAPDFPGMRLAFHVMPGRRMEAWNVAGGSLVPDETARQTIGSEFDGYLICGMKFGVYVGHYLYQAFRIDGADRDSRVPISDECARWTLRNGLRSTRSNTMLGKLRQITSAPIAIIPTPMKGEDWNQRPLGAWDSGERQWAQAFECAARDIANEWCVSICLQPAGTLASPLKTKSVYCKADNVHMNADFGAEVLRHALAGFIKADITACCSEDEHANAVLVEGKVTS